jgi:cytochrome c5
MKKVFTILSLTVLVWSCTKKMTPAKSETPSSNIGSASATNNNSPASMSNTANATAPAPTSDVAAAKTLPPAAVTKPEEASLIAGQKTFNAKCQRCHGLKVPGEYTDLRWVQIMQVMSIKANLDATEKENVLAFVRANAKKG